MKHGYILFILALCLLCPWGITVHAETASGSADVFSDAHDYTLEVVSEHGNPSPAAGAHSTYCRHSTVACSAGTQSGYTCTGWSGTGSVPATGNTGATGVITLTDPSSTITWNWAGSKAIIVAGSGDYPGNNLWAATEYNANFGFRVLLKSRGYSKDRIRYLSHNLTCDTDGDTIPDVDDEATGEKLEFAITEWAKDAADLFIYMTGHGGAEAFLIGEFEKVYANHLDRWLDDIQQIIPGNVVMVYDSCHSGGFVEHLKPPLDKTRVLAVSADSDQEAYFPLEGRDSFSSQFWSNMYNAETFYNSYVFAKEGIREYSDAQIDADGDGVPNEKQDTILAAAIEVGQTIPGAGDLPRIGGKSEDRTLTGVTSAEIWVSDVIDANGIQEVWAVIKPPGYTVLPGDPITELPTVKLKPNADRYSGTYDGFDTSGTYNISIFAIDTEGYCSLPVFMKVTVESDLPACSGCGGDKVEIKDRTFGAETDCECWAGQSITLSEKVVIESGANILFRAPTVNIKSMFNAKPGATVRIEQE